MRPRREQRPAGGIRVRSGFTIAEVLIASCLVTVVLGLAFTAITRGTGLASRGVARMVTAQGAVILRTHLQRDVALAGSLDRVTVDPSFPDQLMVKLRSGQAALYFVLDGELFRQLGSAPAVRLARNFHGTFRCAKDQNTGQLIVGMEGSDPIGLADPAAPGFYQGYALSATEPSEFEPYYRNEVAPPPWRPEAVP